MLTKFKSIKSVTLITEAEDQDEKAINKREEVKVYVELWRNSQVRRKLALQKSNLNLQNLSEKLASRILAYSGRTL